MRARAASRTPRRRRVSGRRACDGRADPIPAQFKRETHTVNGVKTVVLTAGNGEPLVFLHGAGIWHGINFALPWTEKFRVIVPFHPGFAESGDDPAMNDMHDYVMHYLDLFDALGIDKFRLVGFSLGGWLAAKFAVEHGDRVERLVLVGPAGLRGKERPKGDVLSLPPEKIPVAAGLQLRRDQAIPAGKSERSRFHGRALSRRRNAGAAVVGASLRHQAAALPAPADHADALGLGRRRQAATGQDTPRLWRQHLPKAEFKTFKGAGHLVLDEKREAVDAVHAVLVVNPLHVLSVIGIGDYHAFSRCGRNDAACAS